MQGNPNVLAKQQSEVQRLAHKVHRAKVAMDDALWGAGGLPTDPEALGYAFAYLRNARGPDSVSVGVKDAHRLSLAYRRLRTEYMLAKAELDALSSQAAVPERIRATREMWKKKFAAAIREDGKTARELHLDADPDLQKVVSDTLAESVRKLKRDRSRADIGAALVSLAAAQEMGFDTIRPGECKAAFETARRVAEELLKEAESAPHTDSEVLQQNIRQLRALVMWLGS